MSGADDNVGGATLKVTKKTTLGGERRFRGAVDSVILDVDIPNLITTSPNGPQLFGEAIVELMEQNVPHGMTSSNLKAGIKFESSEILESFGMPFKQMTKVGAGDIVKCMEAMAQLNKSVLELEIPKVTVHITYINPPSGNGKRFGIEKIMDLPLKKIREDDESQSSLATKESNLMKNDVESNCLFHAVLQAEAYYDHRMDKFDNDKRNRYRRSLAKNDKSDTCHDIYRSVKDMKKASGIAKSENFDCVDIKQLQETVYAGKFQIICFAKNSNLPYYAGPFVGVEKQLVIYLSDGHYRGVRSIKHLLNTSYYCCLCHVKYENVTNHYKCALVHLPCGQIECPTTPQDEKKKCEKCFFTFRSEVCYKNHLKKGARGGKSRCDYTKYCTKCMTSYYWNKNNNSHVCGDSFCHRCQTTRQKGHACSMQPSVKNEKRLTRKRLYFDFESRADPETGRQIPVLFTALRCCPVCSDGIPKDMESAKGKKCKNCAPDGRLKVIECITPENRDVNVSQQATDFIFGDHHRNFVAVAHNASGFDGQFILESMIASNKAAPEICLDGTKLIFMKFNNVKLLDSLKYLTMSLSAVGKTFQVDTVKGDFPVLFIKPENYAYEGPLPDDEYYALENKPPAVKKQLVEFLAKERADNKVFNFYEEIMKYCFSDVYILATAMTIFEKAFEAMTNVCLLEETTTAASAAALVFRRNHLHKDKPIILDAKPSVSINNSVLSQKYLAWIGSSENVQINISTTYGEEKVGNHRVDGFIPPCPKYPQGQIIEYFGCYYHAHTCTYSGESIIGDKGARDI